ncbi:CDC48 family AAA ATPase [Thermogladius sp. 4427co]|uniref:CDC48 family AAA ATPase n=1 Tax=Thermogladius sp. 4427co TaxID=3450718 RepID=UPI003F78EE0A
MSGEKIKITLRVLEAEPRDVGKGVARIDPDVMERTGLLNGDVVTVEGKRKTVVRVMEGRPQDRGLGVIRIDNTTRQNAGVKIGDIVIVEKVEAQNAHTVKLAPSKYYAPTEPQLADFVKNKILNRPVMEEDVIVVQVLGQAIPFKVIYTKPKGPVVITKDTIISISEKPMETYKLPRVTYEDIGGMKHIIQRVRELIELPLKHPELFRKLGIEPPKGILLYGPPGTGKTLLAKAVANEADAYFIAINGPEIMSKYYGESEQRLREIFEQAKKNAPAIIFIDEIDAIAPKRDEVVGEVERRVVAQLLALMDGLEARGDVIVIGATNRPNALDPALRRPGRFDREIEIPMPDKNARLEILQIHTRGVPLAKDVDLNKLAEITHGYTGADLAALVREAALHALRRYLPEINLDSPSIPFEVLEKLEVRMEDFMAAFKEIVPSGLREVFVEVPEVRWSDIGGLDAIKQELRMSIEWPLKYPDTFKRLGIKPPKGILLYGPPGTGKTLLAKAVATESGANFIAIRGPEVLSKWVGESEKAIREVFRKARLYAPCVIFFDEIDSIAPVRGYAYDSGVSERVVSQLITEMDGIEKLENVVVIAATNRPDMLDPALLRPGRFDKLIYVPPPDINARLEILKIHTRNMPLAEDVDLYEIARATEGYSGADLEALVREAALNAIKEDLNIEKIHIRHFKEALNKVKPSITQEMLKFYIEWGEKAKQKLPREYARPQVYV